MRLGPPTRPDLTPPCMEGPGAAALVGRSFHEKVNKNGSCYLYKGQCGYEYHQDDAYEYVVMNIAVQQHVHCLFSPGPISPKA